MSAQAELTSANGGIAQENSPGLALLVGVEDSPWVRGLDADHPSYPLFSWALSQQHQWGRRTHAGFWRAALPLWPRKRGNPRRAGLLAGWVHRWREHYGYPVDAIEVALDYRPGSLARMGVVAEADQYGDRMEAGKVRADEWIESAPTRDREKAAWLVTSARKNGFLDPDAVLPMFLGLPTPWVVRDDDDTFDHERHSEVVWEALGPAERARRTEVNEIAMRAEARMVDAMNSLRARQ